MNAQEMLRVKEALETAGMRDVARRVYAELRLANVGRFAGRLLDRVHTEHRSDLDLGLKDDIVDTAASIRVLIEQAK